MQECAAPALFGKLAPNDIEHLLCPARKTPGRWRVGRPNAGMANERPDGLIESQKAEGDLLHILGWYPHDNVEWTLDRLCSDDVRHDPSRLDDRWRTLGPGLDQDVRLHLLPFPRAYLGVHPNAVRESGPLALRYRHRSQISAWVDGPNLPHEWGMHTQDESRAGAAGDRAGGRLREATHRSASGRRLASDPNPGRVPNLVSLWPFRAGVILCCRVQVKALASGLRGDIERLFSPWGTNAGRPSIPHAAERILTRPGPLAIVLYRASHQLWRRGLETSAEVIWRLNFFLTGADIHPGAEIGGGLRLTHTAGLVIGRGVRIGSNVTILHGVTIGGSGKAWFDPSYEDGYPVIGDGTDIMVGAKVLGPIKVGTACFIGANAVLAHDLPDGEAFTPGREFSQLERRVSELEQVVTQLRVEVSEREKGSGQKRGSEELRRD